MKVNLVLKNNNTLSILKSADLQTIDKETYQLKEKGLREKYHLQDEEGTFIISYMPENIPLKLLELYNFTDEELSEEKYLSLNYDMPIQANMKKDLYDLLDFSTMKKLYEQIKDNFSSEENLYFCYGVAFKNEELCLKVLNNFLLERMQCDEGYFFTRYLKDYISKVKEDSSDISLKK